jgi:hypothetical protein
MVHHSIDINVDKHANPPESYWCGFSPKRRVLHDLPQQITASPDMLNAAEGESVNALSTALENFAKRR